MSFEFGSRSTMAAATGRAATATFLVAARDPRVITAGRPAPKLRSSGRDYGRPRPYVRKWGHRDGWRPPRSSGVLPQFIAKWQEGHDVVFAIREHRKENLLYRVAYAAFYKLIQRIASIHIPLDSGDFCIMDRRVVDLLATLPERNRFVRGIRSWVGLDQVGLAYERQARYAGKPKYTCFSLCILRSTG
jgi:dolichol-phosphate mannosyltransferase